MQQVEPTEEEIDAAGKHRGQGDVSSSLVVTQELLMRAQDQATRMGLLFNLLYCSTQLGADDLTETAIKELETMPDPQYCRVLANSIRANAEIDLGRPQNALAIIELNLETGFFERDDFRVHKYQLCFFKGKALERLNRWDEALEWLDKAHSMYPDEASSPDETVRQIFSWAEIEILFNKARCLMGLKQFDEAYELSKQAYELAEGDTKTVAMQYMADCRMWQGRVTESLRLYLDIQKRPPCVSVRAECIQDRISSCIDYLEKCKPNSKHI